MERVRLGRTGLQVSALCFGTMSFGGDADEAEAGRLYAKCRDVGIDFFDCANVYNGGASEKILGKLIAHERREIVLTSKVGMPEGRHVNTRGLNRRHIVQSIEDSLRRLNTDRLDILFMHRWDPATPIDETLRALEDIVRAGKVLHLGASNFAAWQFSKALQLQKANGFNPIEIIQPMYNLLKRQAEVEILPWAKAEDIAVISYGPNAAGVLTGKYAAKQVEGTGSRLGVDQHYFDRYSLDWYYDVATAFTQKAASLGVHPVTLAVAWVAHNPAITCPIIGARRVQQLEASLAAVDFEMTAALYAELCALSPTPPPATDRLEEQLS